MGITKPEPIKRIYQIVTNRRLKQIARMIKLPRTRMKAKLSVKYKTKNEKYQRNIVNKAIELYNIILDEIKELDKRKFSQKLKRIFIEDVT